MTKIITSNEFEGIRIKWVNYGVSNSFNYAISGHKRKIIEINKDLIDYPNLLKAVISHELRHSNNDSFNLYDLKIDLTNKDKIPTFQLLGFMFSHPRALIQLSPIWFSKKKGIILDLNLALIYGIAIILSIILFLKI